MIAPTKVKPPIFGKSTTFGRLETFFTVQHQGSVGETVPKSAQEADEFIQSHDKLKPLPKDRKFIKGFKKGNVTYVLADDGKWYTK